MSVLAELRSICDLHEEYREPEVAAGLVIRFASENRPRAGDDAMALAQRVFAAVASDRLCLYFDRFGRMEGYAVLGLLDAQAYDRFIHGETVPSDFLNPRTGTHCCVLDFCANGPSVRRILFDLKRKMKMQAETVTYLRIKGNRRVCKRVRFSGKAEIAKKD